MSDVPRASFGPYALEEELGRGATGRVFRARHVPTGAVRAIKVLTGAHDPEAVVRFRREAEALARLGGAGIVPVHEAGVERGQLYFAMAFVAGGSLRSRLRTAGKLPWREAVSLAARVAVALARCHAVGIIHRDVKPDNILLDEAGEPWLADFGGVRSLEASRLTETGVSLGTLAYMSPEQLLGRAVDARSDVFAVATMLHELVSGEPPCLGRTVGEQLAARRSRARPRVAAHGAPAALDAILDRALTFDEAARTGSSAELAAELEGLLVGREPVKKQRPPLADVRLAVGLAVVVVALLALFFTRGSRAAAADLASARAELVVGRKALATAEADTATLTSGGDLSLASARDSATRAREHAERAQRAGLAGAEAATEAALVLEDDASRVAAERLFLRGSPAEALAALDGMRPLAAPVLVRVRALLALGRFDDADRALDAVAGSTPGEAALELRGDVKLAKGDRAGARAAYDRAVPLGGGEARLKRGSLAAITSDDATALADLAVLVPNLTALPTDRASNARLERFAPALYRHAVAAPDPAERQRALEAAWRLGPPPRESASEVARCWTSLMPRGMSGSFSSTRQRTPRETAALRRAVQVCRRAFETDPSVDLRGFWDFVSLLRFSVTGGPIGDFGIILASARETFGDWPDHPTLLLLEALAARVDHPLDCLALAMKGLDQLPDFPKGPSEVSELARALLNLIFDVDALQDHKLELDFDRLTRGARRSLNAKCWTRLAAAESERGLMARALACLDAGSLEDALPEDRADLEEARFHCFTLEGRLEAALASARTLVAGTSSAHTRRCLADALAATGRWDEILETFPVARDLVASEDRKTLVVVVRALEKRGRDADASALVARAKVVYPGFEEEHRDGK